MPASLSITPASSLPQQPVWPPADSQDPFIRDFSYAAFFDRFQRACTSHDVSQRATMHQEINTWLTHLHTQESALQLLVYRLAHMHIAPGLQVRLAIARDIAGAPQHRYAPVYEVTEVWAARTQGGPALVLQPVGDAHASCATLVVLRGTRSWRKADILTGVAWPTGIRDDLHPSGIGTTSCAWLTERFVNLAQSVRHARRELVVVGHSLGGAVAAGLVAQVAAHQRDHIHLFSYKPPGTSEKHALALQGDAERVHVIEHDDDITSWFGSHQLAGTYIRTRGVAGVPWYIQFPHAVPHLAICEIAAGEADIDLRFENAPRRGSRVLEALRVGAGIVLGWAVPS